MLDTLDLRFNLGMKFRVKIYLLEGCANYPPHNARLSIQLTVRGSKMKDQRSKITNLLSLMVKLDDRVLDLVAPSQLIALKYDKFKCSF